MSELEPCKFCGSDRHFWGRDKMLEGYWYECDNCGARTAAFDTIEQAAAAWNRKPEPQPITPEALQALGFEKGKGHDFDSFMGMDTKYYSVGLDEDLDFLHIEHREKCDCGGGLGVGFYVKSIEQVKNILFLLNQEN